MIGVVLAGGRSTRLGQDKVRLRLPGDGRDMLARTADLLAACTDGVVISCRAPDAGEETLALPGIRSIPTQNPASGRSAGYGPHSGNSGNRSSCSRAICRSWTCPRCAASSTPAAPAPPKRS